MNWQILSLITLLCVPLLDLGLPVGTPLPRPSTVDSADLPERTLRVAGDSNTLAFGPVAIGLRKDGGVPFAPEDSLDPVRFPQVDDRGPDSDQFFQGGLRWLDTNRSNFFAVDSVLLPITFRPTSEGDAHCTYVVAANRWDAINRDSVVFDSVNVTGTAISFLSVRQPADRGNIFNDVIDFGSVPVGETKMIEVEIGNSDPRPIAIQILGSLDTGTIPFRRSDPEQFGRIGVVSGDTVLLQLYYKPQGPRLDTNYITIQSVEFGYRTFTLLGNGVAPQIDAGLREINFMGPDSCRKDSIQLRNTGGDTLDFNGKIHSFSGRFTVVVPADSSIPPLAPDESTWVVFEYCGEDTAADSLYITSNSFLNSDLSIVLRPGTRPPARLEFVQPQPSLDFGEVEIGACQDVQVMIRNDGGRTTTLDSVESRLTEGDPITISISRGAGLPRILRPGESVRFTATYCPTNADGVKGSLYAWSTIGDSTSIPIGGQGKQTPIAVRLDTVSADAGTMLSLTAIFSSAPPGDVDSNVYSLRLRYDPKALFPVNAYDSLTRQPWRLERDPADPGLLLLSHTAGRSTSRVGPLVAIRFRGLSSGKDSNVVVIESGSINSIKGGAGTLLDLQIGGPGLVLLRGCDIELTRGLDRRTTIRGVSLDGSEALLRYIAPEGSTVIMTMTAIDGSVVHRLNLPETSSGEQKVPVDLSSVPPGFYLLDLRVGDGHSSIPLMISR